ncbi:MAG: methyltransferase regulatory domain-containing protein, partial [Bdellovibrionales bacterium]|nr:methyltransferase regulatory domain-containing protein [Bdellovibrionales bacterium]
LGLKNVEYRLSDFRSLGKQLGQFDYIIAHGIYSWISAEAQPEMLKFIAESLKPDGVAYVSYNVYPGWANHEQMRNLMRFHVRDAADAVSIVKGAREIVEFVSSAIPEELSSHSNTLANINALISKTMGQQLLHDHLEVHNNPVYFYEFASKASHAGLRYVGDALFGSMGSLELSPEMRQKLHEYSGGQIVQTEQYLDFIRNRSFRQTLLCHKSREMNRTVHPSTVFQCAMATQLQASTSSPDMTEGAAVEFMLPGSRAKVVVTSSLVKHALRILEAAWPTSMAFNDLISSVKQKMAGKESNSIEEQLSGMVLELYAKAVLMLFSVGPKLEITYGAAPRPFAPGKLYAARQQSTVNAYHQAVVLNDFNRMVLTSLDGQKTLEQITNELTGKVTPEKGSLKDAVASAVEKLYSYALIEA